MPEIESSNIKKEYEELLKELSNPELISNWSDPADKEKLDLLLEHKAFLEKIIAREEKIRELKKRIEENKAILISEEDAELSSLAQVEINQLTERLKSLEENLEETMKNFSALKRGKKSNKEVIAKAVIMEIRAGTGGQEAALFAADLFRMYSKYSQIKNWEQKILDSKTAELGGIKEIIFELKPGLKNKEGVWDLIKNEAGVHRVQRIPTTEKSGRIHTSTASVAVLPKPKKGKITIHPQELKIDTYKASGPGGQYVNKRETAVRITHLPTGTIVTSQTERSLQQNKENALSILEAKIMEKQIKEEEEKLKDKRKTQIGKAERSEKVRTYNFPQNRMTDHRLQKSWYNLEKILDGELETIIQAFQKEKTSD